MDSKILREAALAYQAVYDENLRQELAEEQIWEQVENWVNSLLEEGYDLSDYTWEEMYESYLNEMGPGPRATKPGVSNIPPTTKNSPYNIKNLGAAQYSAYKLGGGDAAMSQGKGTAAEIIARGRKAVKAFDGGPRGPKPQKPLGNIPKAEGTGLGGPSDLAKKYGRDTTSYQSGGGARSGKSIEATMQQGRKNLRAMDQSQPAPAGAKPTSGPSSVNPKTGLSAFPAAKSAVAAKPIAPAAAKPTSTAAAKPTAPAAAAAPKPAATPAATPAPAAAAPKPAATPAPKPSALAQRVAGYKAGGPAMGAREKALNQSFDLFDVVLGHLLDEGYADTEDAALAIMANMSEQWKQSILEG